jgi:hypothetical protein
MAITIDTETLTTDDEVSVDRQPEPEYLDRGFPLGLAEPGDDGRVLKNPEPVPGQVYLLWDESMEGENRVAFIVTYTGQFNPCGYITRPRGEDAAPTIQHSSSMYIQPEHRAWVKAHFAEPSLTEEQLHAAAEQVTDLRTELAREQEKFAAFGDALNEMADDHDWCASYDTIVRDLGLPGRERDYWVEVEAEVTIEDNDPSSRLDERLGYEYGASISATYVEVRGKVTVRVGSITASSAENAQENVSEEDVQSELDNMFSADISLGDWEVTNSGQEDS